MDAGSTDVGRMETRIAESSSAPVTIESNRQSDILLAEIRITEQRIAENIRLIQEKLTTENIGKHLIKVIQDGLFRRIGAMNREKYSEYGRKISQGAKETVRNYPGSITLLGLGVGWFLLENYLKQSKEEQEMLSPPEESIHTDFSPASEITAASEEQDSKIAHLKESARHYKEVAMEKSHAAKDQMSHYIDENPLMVGFIGLSAGLIAGVLSSGVFRESELLNETRRTIKEKTQELVKETKEKAAHVVDVARKAAKEEAERQNLITH